MSVNISGLVICFNEENNIERCLASLDWCMEVVVVDSFSTDRTPAIAKSFSNVRFIQRAWEGFSRQKMFALGETSNDWVFWLDADECLEKGLSEEVQEIAETGNWAAASFPRKTYFLGKWIRHTGWYPGRVVRLFNKNKCSFNNNILHEGIEVPPNEALREASFHIEHFSYPDLYTYFDKMNGYGAAGALELQRKGKSFSFFQLLINPLVTFIKFYFFKSGYKDGLEGFVISVGSSFSNFIKYVNFAFLQRKNQNHND